MFRVVPVPRFLQCQTSALCRPPGAAPIIMGVSPIILGVSWDALVLRIACLYFQGFCHADKSGPATGARTPSLHQKPAAMPPRMLLPRLGTAYRMPVVPRFLSSEHTLAGGTGERPPCPLPYIRTCFLAFFQELIRPTGPSGDTLPDCRRACTLSPRACGSTLGQDGLPRGAASGFPTLASTTPLSVARARSGRRDNCSSGCSRSSWRSNSRWHLRRSRWPHRRSWWASAAAAAGAAAAHAVELHVPQRHRPSTGQRPHPITLSRHVCLTRGGIRPFVGMPGLSGGSNARRSARRAAAPLFG